MPNHTGRSWKLTRATVHKKANAKKAHPERTNKYSAHDKDERPSRGSRSRVWVGGYKRSDGTYVEGHYRETPHAA